MVILGCQNRKYSGICGTHAEPAGALVGRTAFEKTMCQGYPRLDEPRLSEHFSRESGLGAFSSSLPVPLKVCHGSLNSIPHRLRGYLLAHNIRHVSIQKHICSIVED